MPQPEVLLIIASRPLFKYSSYQRFIFFLKDSWANLLLPKWWFREPQQLISGSTTTSTPCRLSKRIVDSFISGEMTL